MYNINVGDGLRTLKSTDRRSPLSSGNILCHFDTECELTAPVLTAAHKQARRASPAVICIANIPKSINSLAGLTETGTTQNEPIPVEASKGHEGNLVRNGRTQQL